MSNCFSLSGTKIYGTRTYRTINEKSSNEPFKKRVQEKLINESFVINRTLTEKEQQDFKHFQKHLEAVNETKDEKLKKYLSSFNSK